MKSWKIGILGFAAGAMVMGLVPFSLACTKLYRLKLWLM